MRLGVTTDIFRKVVEAFERAIKESVSLEMRKDSLTIARAGELYLVAKWYCSSSTAYFALLL